MTCLGVGLKAAAPMPVGFSMVSVEAVLFEDELQASSCAQLRPIS